MIFLFSVEENIYFSSEKNIRGVLGEALLCRAGVGCVHKVCAEMNQVPPPGGGVCFGGS